MSAVPAGALRGRGRRWTWVFALLLAACAGTPPQQQADDPMGAPLPPVASPHAAFEQAQRDRAAAMARQGRLFDAAIAWEVLVTLRPDLPEYRERLAQARQAIDAAVAERLPRAQAAAKRGDTDAAVQGYLAVLALQPDNGVAADALRAIERERNKRNYLGKPSRITLTRRAVIEAEMAPDAAAASNDREHAALLASQGEIDEAIGLLERRTAAGPRDEAVRRALADLYVRKAESLPAGERQRAVALLRKALALDPGHATAAERLKQRLAPARPPAPAPAASRPPG